MGFDNNLSLLVSHDSHVTDEVSLTLVRFLNFTSVASYAVNHYLSLMQVWTHLSHNTVGSTQFSLTSIRSHSDPAETSQQKNFLDNFNLQPEASR